MLIKYYLDALAGYIISVNVSNFQYVTVRIKMAINLLEMCVTTDSILYVVTDILSSI